MDSLDAEEVIINYFQKILKIRYFVKTSLIYVKLKCIIMGKGCKIFLSLRAESMQHLASYVQLHVTNSLIVTGLRHSRTVCEMYERINT